MKKVIAWNLGLLLMIIVAAELVFGSWIKGPSYGTMLLPRNLSYRFDVSTLYGREEPVRYTRDAHGLRGRYDSLAGIEILTLGGSTTNQLYVDDSETWQEVMSDAFRAEGRPVDVVNAGVDGQSTYGNIAVFDQWFPHIHDLKAPYILVYAGINDVGLSKSNKFDSMKSPEGIRRIRYYILNNSALYHLFRTLRGVWRASKHKVIHGESPLCGKPFQPGPKRADILPAAPGHEAFIEGYRSRLRILVGRIRDFGAQPILVTQPTAEYRFEGDRVMVFDDAAAYATIMAYNRALMEECTAQGAICVDLANRLELDPCDFYDRIHLNALGAAKVGRFLHGALKDRLEYR